MGAASNQMDLFFSLTEIDLVFDLSNLQPSEGQHVMASCNSLSPHAMLAEDYQ